MKLIDQIQNKESHSTMKCGVPTNSIHCRLCYTTMNGGQVHVHLPTCHEPTTSNAMPDPTTSGRVQYLLRDLWLTRRYHLAMIQLAACIEPSLQLRPSLDRIQALLQHLLHAPQEASHDQRLRCYPLCFGRVHPVPQHPHPVSA